MNSHFANVDELKAFIKDKEKGGIPITYLHVPGYTGMALYIGLHFDIKKTTCQLNLEWMCFGLDLYGDTLQESYLYEFKNLDAALKYLYTKYNVAVTDIPVKFSFDYANFPNPIKDAAQEEIFKAAWSKFQKDFKQGVFLDKSLHVAYASNL